MAIEPGSRDATARGTARRPYSSDLRQRVVDAVDRGEISQREGARRFEASLSFVVRLLQHRRRNGGLEPKSHGGEAGFKLSIDERIRLFDLARRHPDATLQQLKDMGGFACTLVTIWRMLRRARWTRKKKSLHANERDRPDVKEARRRFRRKVERIAVRRLIFLDETGVDTTMTPTRGWAPKGRRVEGSAPGSCSTTTVVSAMGLDGLRGSLAFPGAMDEPAFRAYVEDVLTPHLHPGDLVVSDNLRVHDAQAAEAAVEKAGAKEVRLPPCGHDYNPIEQMWSKLKSRLHRTAARTTPALYQAIADALDHITTKDIRGWINYSGLYAIPR
ncbi:IS630 family transposase [Paludisphaera mucosa]|uniref:IS630 family transposase n=1 Tax=Paludisphaera mucosa TaxID=3030827 RepID=A0ABT6FD14_9BACT|nr:IS630 family transposase [Paludisphaera mucosa]MDG3005483.1 IS630 family transposase [Paludisphaera mucosa]